MTMTPDKDRIISVRLTEAQRNELGARAEALGITLSDFVRRSLQTILFPPTQIDARLRLGPAWTRTQTTGGPTTTSIVWEVQP